MNPTEHEKCVQAENGIPIYHFANRHLHSFCIGLYIRAGSLYEPDDQNGVSHLWEHALFRKLNGLYGGDFYRELDRLGLSFTACTYKEFIQIRVKGAPEHFSTACDLMARVFEPMRLSGAELELEKKRIKAEIREDDEKSSLDYFTAQIVWQDTPLRNTITGQNRVIDKIGVRALEAVQDSILRLGHLFFYVTGCFDHADIAYLSRCVGRCTLPPAELPRQNMAPVPRDFFRRGAGVAVKNSPYHYLRLSFDVDVARCEPAVLDLIYDILFAGETSKLFQELSEKTGLIYGFDARFERYANIGCLYVSFDIQQRHILPALEQIVAMLNVMKSGLTDELAMVLPTYTTNAAMILDSDEDLNWTFAYERHIMNAAYTSIDARRRCYEVVTVQQVMQVSRQLFRPDNTLLTLKADKKRFDADQAKAILQQLQ